MVIRIILFVLAAVAFSANGQSPVGGDPSTLTQPRVTTVTELDNGSTICIKVGEVIEVSLKAQFGTGYRWELVKSNKKRLKLIGQTVETPPSGQESSPEIQVFRFDARSAGSFYLRLDYVRPWEKGVDPLKTFSLRGKVTKRNAK